MYKVIYINKSLFTTIDDVNNVYKYVQLPSIYSIGSFLIYKEVHTSLSTTNIALLMKANILHAGK